MPYWIIKNPLYNYYNPLRSNIKTEAAVIGSGITGALVAHSLVKAGVECTVVDKRTVATGSTVASTALLQYEIDVPLCRLSLDIGEDKGVTAYKECLRSISVVGDILEEVGFGHTFEKVPTIYLASNHKGLEMLKQEYEIRTRHDLPSTFLKRQDLYKLVGIKAPGALMNNSSAQIDTYEATTAILDYDMKNNGLKVYSPTEVIRWQKNGDGYILETDGGHKIECKYVIIAAGFEAGKFLPEKLMKLTTTFAIISQPVDEEYIWYKRSLIWETKTPYIYVRTDRNNRIIIGGEDDNNNSVLARRFLLARKRRILERKFNRLFPKIPFVTDMAWCGTFSSTKDGLPLIGGTAKDGNMLFALGYGGNGITFSVIASEVITNIIVGKEDSRQKLFSLERPSLK